MTCLAHTRRWVVDHGLGPAVERFFLAAYGGQGAAGGASVLARGLSRLAAFLSYESADGFLDADLCLIGFGRPSRSGVER